MACRIEMLNGNSSYRKILIKEMEIFCEFVGGHRNKGLEFYFSRIFEMNQDLLNLPRILTARLYSLRQGICMQIPCLKLYDLV